MDETLLKISLKDNEIENITLKISSLGEQSHELVYRKGVDSLLRLENIASNGYENSESLKLFLYRSNLNEKIDVNEVQIMSKNLLSDCLNVLVLYYIFNVKLGEL